MDSSAVVRERLLRLLRAEALVTADEREIVGPHAERFTWFLDFKGVILRPGVLHDISELFWEHLKTVPALQVGGLETVAIALVSGVVMRAHEEGRELNAFFVRKSRKVDGMQRMIEGALTDEPVVLIDDGLNSGKSIIRQVEALKKEGKKVIEVCVMCRFRDLAFYEYFAREGIAVWSLFTLEDFPESGGMVQRSLPATSRAAHHFDHVWHFTGPKSEYFHIVPKSAPVLAKGLVCFGTDDGSMWGVSQETGEPRWRHRIAGSDGRKTIFSSPAVSQGILCYGAYDGNVYGLDVLTGEEKWVSFEADWVGSSPCPAEDLGLMFIGLEFGLWRKHGGIVALKTKTGEKVWWHQVDTHVHSTPVYSKKLGLLFVGSEGGVVYCLDARTGALRWMYQAGGSVKAGLALDESRGLVCFGSWNNKVHLVRISDGTLVHSIDSYKPVYSTPVVWHGRLYMGLLDKRVVCINLDSGEIVWSFQTQSRIFGTPLFVEESLYIGSNDGRMYQIDPKTGKELSFLQLTERIVNKVVYDDKTKRFFVPTFANELYCVTKKRA